MRSRQSADDSQRAPLRLVPPLDDCAPALDLAVGDIVVYASHGIGCVEARLGGDEDLRALVVLTFASGLRVTLPVARARGVLRLPSSKPELEGVRRTLRSSTGPRIEPWAKRFRSMRDKLAAGEVTGLAEVVRDGLGRERELADCAGDRATAATSERGLYLQARKLLAAEIAFARGTDAAEADAWIVEQSDGQAQG
jgi:RNA polymerase-interacting CarD/CdnL/TRCF family regulator